MKDNWDFVENAIRVMEATASTAPETVRDFLTKHGYLQIVKEPRGVVAILPGKTDTQWYTYHIRTDKGLTLLTKLLFNKITRMQAIKELSDLVEAEYGKETNENV